jgi:prepilin-type processing-associated H-X9-DG protein
MNCFMNSLAPMGDTTFYVFRKTTQIVRPPPSQTWVFIDEHEDSIEDGWFEVALPSPTQAWLPHCWIELPASRHNGGATLSFADGHVEIKKWLDSRTRKSVTRTRYIPVIEENPDAAWLQERTTGLQPQ